MPADLKDQIAAAAKGSGRSLHAELVHRLQGSSALIDRLAELSAAHAYDQAVNTGLMREKADLQAQLAKKDAEIQILKQRLFLGTMDVPEAAEQIRDSVHQYANQEFIDKVVNAAVDRTISAVIRGKLVQVYAERGEVLPAEPRASTKPNKVSLVGNLERDPEINYVTPAKPVRKATPKPPKTLEPSKR